MKNQDNEIRVETNDSPTLVTEQVCVNEDTVAYRWKLVQRGQTLAESDGLHPDPYAASDAAAQSALMILHIMSSSFVRLGRDVAAEQAAAEKKSAKKKTSKKSAKKKTSKKAAKKKAAKKNRKK